MNKPLVERVKRYQQILIETGIAGTASSEAVPKTLLDSSSLSDSSPETAFKSLITEKEIASVSTDLFASGHYNLAVSQAYKAMDKFIEEKSKIVGKSGRDLMNTVFSPKSPILAWTERKTTSEQNEQEGYHLIFSGAMAAVRNPVTHEFGWVEEPEQALELIMMAQHLLRKAKLAKVLSTI